ncbi:MAG: hypothetical protein QOK25_1114, partial [Thermoleophilaceae bacterium]|nr:hypothetical protein [Thermoleophilaceae bacterium]
MSELSVVVPVYGCAGCLTALHRRLVASIDPLGIDYELVLVDDRSPDGSWDVLTRLGGDDPRVRPVRLERHAGEEAAIREGLARSSGRYVVVMDCDLQDAPEDVPRLYAAAVTGRDVVLTRRTRAADAGWRVRASRAYHAAMAALFRAPLDPAVGNFSVVSRGFVADLLAGPARHYRLALQRSTLPSASIDVERRPRAAGTSAYTAVGLARHALSGVRGEARSRAGAAEARSGPPREPYHETLARVERTHWWLAALRDLVAETLAARSEPGARVLDVGCSTGHVLNRLPASYDRVGVDADAEAVALAARLRPDVRFLHASADELPFEDAAFDAVIATDVLSDARVRDDAVALREIRRVIRPGGVLIVQVPAYQWLWSAHDVAVGTARRYTRPALRRLLAGAGLEPVRVSYRVTALFPAAVLHRLAARGSDRGDVEHVAPALNRALAAVMRIENRVVARRSLPFGLSVFALARAPGRSRVDEFREGDHHGRQADRRRAQP